MAKNSFLDSNGLVYLWDKIKALITQAVSSKVEKVDGKGLSTNDYTTEEKNKLAGIADGATKVVVEDTLTSTSPANALSAAQGKALNDRITSMSESMGNLGYGDMMKSTYDADDDGVIDNAANATKLDGQSAAFYTNVIESISVNGETATPTGKAVDIKVPTAVEELTGSGELVKKPELDNYVTKSEMSNVYEYQGTVGSLAELPTENVKTGAVYNVTADGMNYAWNGSEWDALGAVLDIAVISNTEIDEITA